MTPSENSPKHWKIYALIDPDTSEVRYIGKTEKSLRRRLQMHIQEAIHQKREVNLRKNNWLKKLLRENKQPGIIEIESGNGDWESAERYWIAEYRKKCGDRLTNSADGGICVPKNLHTRETIQKSAKSRKGMKRKTPFTAEHLANLSAAHKGYRHTEEWKRNHAAIMTGKILGPNSWEAIQNQRKVRLRKKAEALGIPVESFPEIYTTPEMIEIALARNGGNQAKTARELRIPINYVRYYDPRRKLAMVN